MTSTFSKKIISSIVLVFVIGFLARAAGVATVVYADTSEITPSTATSTLIGQDLLDLLASFQSVTIDSSLFSDSLFQNLKDFSSVLPVELQGRVNPFAPIGSETGSIQSVSTVPVLQGTKSITSGLIIKSVPQ